MFAEKRGKTRKHLMKKVKKRKRQKRRKKRKGRKSAEASNDGEAECRGAEVRKMLRKKRKVVRTSSVP